jgi:RNA polymerase-binding transcription factor
MVQARHTLSAADRAALKKTLESKRAELMREHRDVLQAATHHDDELTEHMDSAERATEESELLGRADQERQLLEDIDRALAKFADGTYGVSELSGEPIPLARLRAVPWARFGADEEEAEG